MTFHIISLFPESFDSYINASIIGRAIADGKIKIKFYNPRDFTPTSHLPLVELRRASKYKRVDQKPYGGGPGMVLEPLSLIKTIEKVLKDLKKKKSKNLIKVIWTSPSGKQFDNAYAEKVSKKFKDIIIICGRYEGIDERVFKVIKKWKEAKIEKISVGPFVLTGGELGAMVMLDTISRRIPGVLGKIESVEENRVSSSEVYTRPESFIYQGKTYRVPKILLSGYHLKITEWRSRHKK